MTYSDGMGNEEFIIDMLAVSAYFKDQERNFNWQTITVLFAGTTVTAHASLVLELSISNISHSAFQEHSHPACSFADLWFILQTFPHILSPVKASENLCQVSLVPRAFLTLGQYQELKLSGSPTWKSPIDGLLVVSFSKVLKSFSSRGHATFGQQFSEHVQSNRFVISAN